MKQDASVRERKIRRILHLQRQLHRLSQWRLSELQGQEAAIQDKQRDLIGALNGDGRLQGLFVDAMAKRLSSLAGEEARVAVLKKVQNEDVWAHARRVRQSERQVDAATLERRRGTEKKELDEIVERIVTRPDASFP
jgi:hypothetical protein